jgi:hypothetical protein
MPPRLLAALILGVALIVAGIALIHVPSALIAAGLFTCAALLQPNQPQPDEDKERR